MRVYTEILFIFVHKKRSIINQQVATKKKQMSSDNQMEIDGTSKETGIAPESHTEDHFCLYLKSMRRA